MTTASASNKIGEYLRPGKCAHLVGIGGVSMRPLGLVLRSMGMKISGSDMNASVSLEELIANGITVHIGHSADNITGADCVIRTAAAHNDNPEIAAARAAGIRSAHTSKSGTRAGSTGSSWMSCTSTTTTAARATRWQSCSARRKRSSA